MAEIVEIVSEPERREITDRPQIRDPLPIMDTSKFDHMWRIATAIAKMSLLPDHLKGIDFSITQANCFRVVNQAFRWWLDPYAMMDETFVIQGKLGYSGKLIAAVVNSRGGLRKKLSYSYNDEVGDDLEITVSGVMAGEDTPRTVSVRVGDAKTKNTMWTRDPRQKLIYTGAPKWARAHCPEVVLGVLTDDDLDRMRDMGELKEQGDGTYSAPPRPLRQQMLEKADAEREEKAAERAAAKQEQEIRDEEDRLAGRVPETPEERGEVEETEPTTQDRAGAPHAEQVPTSSESPAPAPGEGADAPGPTLETKVREDLAGCVSLDNLEANWESHQEEVMKAPQHVQATLYNVYTMRRDAIEKAPKGSLV